MKSKDIVIFPALTSVYLPSLPSATTTDFGDSEIMASMASPPFHMMGFWSQTLFPMATGSKIVLWAPASPPPVPTPESVIASMRLAKCTAALVVPTFLVSWARDAEAVKFLATMKIIVRSSCPSSDQPFIHEFARPTVVDLSPKKLEISSYNRVSHSSLCMAGQNSHSLRALPPVPEIWPNGIGSTSRLTST